MISEVIEAKPYHCGQMARKLRDGHKAVLIGAGMDTHRQMRAMFDSSCVRKAWLLDGKLMMIGGIEGPLLSREGTIWIALSQDAENYPRRAVMIIREQMQIFMLSKRRLIAFILKDDHRSMKFTARLGFEPVEDISIKGMPATVMVYGSPIGEL